MQYTGVQAKEALFYERLSDGRVKCKLCAHRCVIEKDRTGLCGVRENHDGTLVALTYGRTLVQYVDPVESKPLFHFYPGALTYSVATPGCNLRCGWCQNWGLARIGHELSLRTTEPSPPDLIVSRAVRAGCRIIAYTYTEPTVFFEYAYDTARMAAENGLANICVTNGFMSGRMLETFAPYLDGVSVDLKSFRDETYREFTGGRLAPVLDNLRLVRRSAIWLEVTTPVVPNVNDDPAELRDAARFIARELGQDTPWHLVRIVPTMGMPHAAATAVNSLYRARDIGMEEDLRYVYLDNTPYEADRRTNCPVCNRVLITRRDRDEVENNIIDGRCPACGRTIPGVCLGESWLTP